MKEKECKDTPEGRKIPATKWAGNPGVLARHASSLWKTFASLGTKEKIFWGILALVLLSFTFPIWKHTPCLWKNITGVPCPGCGMSRACTAVFHLDLQSAFQHHPLFLIIPFLAYLFLFPGSWLGRRLVANNLFWCIIGGLFIGAYVIRMIVLFPDHSPMTSLHPCLIDLVRNLF